jgi:hypothetical protein
MPNNPIYLKHTNKLSYIKIINRCSQEGKNLGAISVRRKESSQVWLSIRQPTPDRRYLIDEIALEGGSFTTEPGYLNVHGGKAIGISGSGYQGGVPFANLDRAIEYLQLYFPVEWCKGSSGSSTQPQVFNRNKPPAIIASNKPDQGSSLGNLISEAGALFSKLAQDPNPQEFDKFYNQLSSAFNTRGRLTREKGEYSHNSSKWPANPGVYIVLERRDDNARHAAIVYIGMTGKLSRTAGPIPGRLSLRPGRSDPYSFDQRGFHYKYNRTTKTYSTSIASDDFDVECFVFDGVGTSAPTFLESLLLQAYAICTSGASDRLPPANNQF